MRRIAHAYGYSLVELLVAVAIAGLIGTAILGVYNVSQDTYVRASSLEAAQVGARAGLDRMANELRLIGSYWVGANGAGNAITTVSSNSITFMANLDALSVIGGTGGNEATVPSGSTASGTSVPLSISATAINDAFKCYSNPAINDYIYIANGGMREVRQIATNGSNNTCTNNNTLTLATSLGRTYLAGSLVRDVKTITYARNASATSTCPALACLTRTQGASGADPVVDNVTNLTFTYFLSDGVTTTTNPALIREIQIALTVQSPDGSARRMTTRVRPRSLP